MARRGRRPERGSPGFAGVAGACWTVLFRVALMLQTRAWRDRFLDEATEVFRAGAASRSRESGIWAAHGYALRAVTDAAMTGCRARIGFGRRSRSSPQVGWLDQAADAGWTTLRLAVKSNLKRPGSALVAAGTLSLTIGLTTAMFSLAYSWLFRELPLPDANRIMSLEVTRPPRGPVPLSVSLHEYSDWRKALSSFEDLGAYSVATTNLSGSTRPDRYFGAYVSASTFSVLGAKPILGRGILGEEDQAGAPLVVVLGYRPWVERFGSDPNVVGQTIGVNGEQATIVGVMPKGFRFPFNQDVWVPLRLDPLSLPRGQGPGLGVVGLLKEGVDLRSARAEFSGVGQRLSSAYPEANGDRGFLVRPYTESFSTAGYASLGWTMISATVLILLVGCLNVANLHLGRTASRAQDLAIRTALGASRGRILTQILAEAGFPAVLGGLMGAGMAWVAIGLLEAVFAANDPPFWFRLELDLPILLFILGVSVSAALISGIIPALRAVSPDRALKDVSRGNSSLRIGRLARLLVTGQIAMSVALVVPAGMMCKGMFRLRTMDPGFRTEDIFTARIALADPDLPTAVHRRRFAASLLERLEGAPGVVSATVASTLPGTLAGRARVEVEGESQTADEEHSTARTGAISPDYFKVFGTAVLRGRAFDPSDGPGALPVAIVNESFAERFFAGQDPLGRRIRRSNATGGDEWLTVVGVAPDLQMGGVSTEYEMPWGFYVPAAQADFSFICVAILSRGDPMALTPLVRDEVAALDDNTPLYNVRSMKEVLAANLWFLNTFGSLFGIFGLAALLLASVGLYGVVSSWVGRRTKEVGVRLAVGARRSRVVGMVVCQSLRQAGLGVLVGLGLGEMLSRGLGWAIYLEQSWDLSVHLTVSMVLAIAALAASFAPARRASRIAPTEVLRCE